MSDLEQVGDAAALEKYYHRNCLQYAKRTCSQVQLDDTKVIRTLLCDEEFLLIVQNTLTDGSVSLSMADLNDEYMSVLKRYSIDISSTGNYRKPLKGLITDRLPNVRFVPSVRRIEPDKIVLNTAESKAIEYHATMLDNSEVVGQLKSVASLWHDEILKYQNWTFEGTFDDFEHPPLLQYFLCRILFGKHASTKSQMRNQEIDKTTNVACQFLIQNTKRNRQVCYQAKKIKFEQTVQTPLSIGLPLAIHSRVRNKSLVNNLSELYIGCHYQKILDFEKRLEQGIIQRMDVTGGFCLPSFVKKGIIVWFAVDNIDLLEDTPTGQNTFHGTVLVLNQRKQDGEPLNEPLVIPEKRQSLSKSLYVKYLKEPVIKQKAIRFAEYQHGERQTTSDEYTQAWMLPSCFAARKSVESRELGRFNIPVEASKDQPLNEENQIMDQDTDKEQIVANDEPTTGDQKTGTDQIAASVKCRKERQGCPRS